MNQDTGSMVPLALLVYLTAGLLAGVVLGARERSLGRRVMVCASALLAWPLFAPIALGRERRAAPGGPVDPAGQRIEAALSEAREAVAGSPLEALLSDAQVEDTRKMVRVATRRIAELRAATSRPEFDVDHAARSLASLEAVGAAARNLAPARVRLDGARRLRAMLDEDRRSLDELAGLAEALRTQLTLARYSGSSVEGVGDMVGELSARVAGLDAAMNLDPPPP